MRFIEIVEGSHSHEKGGSAWQNFVAGDVEEDIKSLVANFGDFEIMEWASKSFFDIEKIYSQAREKSQITGDRTGERDVYIKRETSQIGALPRTHSHDGLKGLMTKEDLLVKELLKAISIWRKL